jgi:hypothetical protein
MLSVTNSPARIRSTQETAAAHTVPLGQTRATVTGDTASKPTSPTAKQYARLIEPCSAVRTSRADFQKGLEKAIVSTTNLGLITEEASVSRDAQFKEATRVGGGAPVMPMRR